MSTVHTQPLRFAVVGGGWMGQLHARCIEADPRATIVAVAEPAQHTSEVFRRQFPNAIAFPSLADLLAGIECEVVTICTPSGMHADQTVLALDAGRHVVVEKPIATSPLDARRMVQASEQTGLTLSVIHQYRFNRDALRLKRAIERNLLGRILIANAFVFCKREQGYFTENDAWRANWQTNGGGVLINQAIHAVDLLQWMFGPALSAAAVADNLVHGNIEGEDTITAVVTFENGAQGVLQASQAASRNLPLRLEIVGTDGRAIYERSRLTTWEVEDEVTLLTPEERATFPRISADQEPFGPAHERQFAAIVSALLAGQIPEVRGADASRSLEVVASVYESAGLWSYAA